MDVRTTVAKSVCDHIPEIGPAGSHFAALANQRFDEIGCDSLAVMEVIYDLEETLDTSLSTAQLSNLHTVQDLVEQFEFALSHGQ